MIKVPYDGKVAMMYNFLQHDAGHGNYKPNTQWDEHTNKLIGLLYTNLPHNSSNKSLTDIGSGAGKWPALLSPYFDQIISIEPQDALRKQQHRLFEKLELDNIDVYGDSLPDCISKLNCQAALMVDSLYLTEDWLEAYQSLLADPYLQWIAIADGPDGDAVLGDSIWNTPFHAINNRRPLLAGDEWRMAELAEQQGWASKVFDIMADELMIKDSQAKRWLVILER